MDSPPIFFSTKDAWQICNCGALAARCSAGVPYRRLNAQRIEAPRVMGLKPRFALVPHGGCFRLLSPLHHERGSALADFLKRHFEAMNFLRTQFREHSLHLPGMLAKG